jgi:hypothetical protein
VSDDSLRDAIITDAGTLAALERLRISRLRLKRWTSTLGAKQPGRSGGVFSPRSGVVNAVMSMGKMRMLRWAFSAYMLLRRKRRR